MAILTRRKTAAAALVVVGIAGLSIASAAQLNLAPDTLGAGNAKVTSCQPGGEGKTPIEVSFKNDYDATSKGYNAATVTLSEIAQLCQGLNFKVTVSGDDGVALGNHTGTIGDTTETITLDPNVAAAKIENVAVVIYSAPDVP